LDGILLDGDEMRESISLGAGFSRHDREQHNLKVARLAEILCRQKPVVVSVIAPMEKVRELITCACDPIWVYVKRTLPQREGHFYEEPKTPDLMVDHDVLSPEESLHKILDYIGDPKDEYSLFIGRYQPLHEGHIKLIDSVLEEGKKVVVALRDTPIRSTDPYTTYERKEMFREEFGDQVKVIVIPDIEEVCYGRKVGWGIREIRLDEETESISATKIRELAR